MKKGGYMERRVKRRSKSNKGCLTFIFVLFIICVASGLLLYNLTKNNVEAGKTVVINVPSGSTTSDIGDLLKENGVISNKLLFTFKSKMDGYDGTYKQGTYSINTGTSIEEIMNILSSGSNISEKNKITIPEGYTVAEIGNYLEQKGIVTAEDFINTANTGEFDFDFIKDIPEGRTNRLEGYLFPDTYYISDNATSEEIINKMLTRFNDFYTEENIKKAESLGLTFDEAIIVASIVEKEISAPNERTIAAGVIYNRLEIDMPLQIDSTVLYAMGVTKEVVTYADLETDSPYNTYTNKGLPKGPISNPGQAAIEAALNPDDNDYIYYVLKDRTSGEHYYTNNYDDFLKAKEQYKAQFN